MMTNRGKIYDILVVGAGLSGATVAERLASKYGLKCLVIDRRSYVAGNAADTHDSAGILIPMHGPHYFRTNSVIVYEYLSKFTDWHPVMYRVLSYANGRYWSFPVNLHTYEQLVGHPCTESDMCVWLRDRCVPIESPKNSEELLLSRVGHELYELFFKGYTEKQWGMPASELSVEVCGRIPIRTTRDDRYLSEIYQAMPAAGYTALVDRMLNHPLIDIRLNTDYRDTDESVRHTVYTGPIDAYYDFRYGELPYRSLRFEHETLDVEWYQQAVQVNYPNDHAYTRIVEPKHVTGQMLPRTTIIKEYPMPYEAGMEAYYPVPTAWSNEAAAKYRDHAASEKAVTFLGRQATYRYMNMDKAVEDALMAVDGIAEALC